MSDFLAGYVFGLAAVFGFAAYFGIGYIGRRLERRKWRSARKRLPYILE